MSLLKSTLNYNIILLFQEIMLGCIHKFIVSINAFRLEKEGLL